MRVTTRTALGYDAHPFTKGRALHLCGVTVPDEEGLQGNSDADVGLHALIDALLGAAVMGDIGTHFPPDDPAFRDASSRDLLTTVLQRIRDRHPAFTVTFVDLTILGRRPRLAPHRESMRKSVADLVGLPPECVSLKAGSGNDLGFVGRGEGLASLALVTVDL